jgi:hypothetical protein
MLLCETRTIAPRGGPARRLRTIFIGTMPCVPAASREVVIVTALISALIVITVVAAGVGLLFFMDRRQYDRTKSLGR